MTEFPEQACFVRAASLWTIRLRDRIFIMRIEDESAALVWQDSCIRG